MSSEFQRRFQVLNDGWQDLVTRSEPIVQGYITTGHGQSAWLEGQSVVLSIRGKREKIDVPVIDIDGSEIIDNYQPDTGRIDISPDFEARVRIKGQRAALTLISGRENSRRKLKCALSRDVAEAILDSNFRTGHLIVKDRHDLRKSFMKDEGASEVVVDVYANPFFLTMMQIEFESETGLRQALQLPDWVGNEARVGALNNSRIAETGRLPNNAFPARGLSLD